MTTLEGAVLGLVEGITEFVPVSSTAHLRLVPALFGRKDPGAAFSAVIQLGALAAVVAFFRRDLAGMAMALRPSRWHTAEGRRLLAILVGTMPIGIAGVLLRHQVEGSLRSLWVIAVSLIAVGILFGVMEWRARLHRTFEEISLRDALLIGIAQTIALVPGVSRSGITVVAGLALGFERDAAARFAFLLSIPALAAAGLFEIPQVLRSDDGAEPLIAGLVVALLSGWASIGWLLRFFRARTTLPFVGYRVLLGAILIAMLMLGRV